MKKAPIRALLAVVFLTATVVPTAAWADELIPFNDGNGNCGTISCGDFGCFVVETHPCPDEFGTPPK